MLLCFNTVCYESDLEYLIKETQIEIEQLEKELEEILLWIELVSELEKEESLTL